MEDQGHLLVREHARLKAKNRALVLLPSQGPEPFPFHIIDISEGGLSFSYLGKKIDIRGSFQVSLYYDKEMFVGDLPVKAVSDLQLSNVLVPVRRGSLCFESLDINQRGKLSTFIKTCTESHH